MLNRKKVIESIFFGITYWLLILYLHEIKHVLQIEIRIVRQTKLFVSYNIYGLWIVDVVAWDSFIFFFACKSACTSSIVRISRLFSLGTKKLDSHWNLINFIRLDRVKLTKSVTLVAFRFLGSLNSCFLSNQMYIFVFVIWVWYNFCRFHAS